MTSRTPVEPQRRRGRDWGLGLAAFALLFAAGLGVRLHSLPGVFTAQGTFLAPTDAYYYARLAELSRVSFPAPVAFDPYVSFPGMVPVWPPGHAWVLAVALALFDAEPFSPRGLAVLAWVAPVLSLLGAGWVALLAWRWLRPASAFAAAACVLMIPAAFQAGQLGEADHHLYEVLAAALSLLLFARALRPGPRPLAYALAAGGVIGTAHFVCTSGFLLLPPLALGVLVLFALRPRRSWRAVRALCHVSGAALALVAAQALYLGRLFTADYLRLSGFHVALPAAVLLGTAGLLAWRGRKRKASRRVVLLALVGAAVLCLEAPGLWEQLRTAQQHLGRGSLMLAEADEAVPLFSGGVGSALAHLGGALLALPLVLALLVRAARRHGLALVMAVTLLAAAVPCLAQTRFARPLAGTLAAAAALAVAYGLGRHAQRFERVAAGLSLGLLALPSVASLGPVPGPHPVLALTASSLTWLREQTPSPGPVWDVQARPTYGVLAPWVMGHLLATVAERPAYASPFGQAVEAEQALADTARVFAELDGERVFRRCRELEARYVLALPYPGGRASLERALGHGWPQGVLPALERLRRMPALTGHFRHRFASREQQEGKPLARVFEVVEGARVTVRGPPHARFRLVGTLASAPGPRLEEEGELDDRGEARLTLPHATEDWEGGLVLELGASRTELQTTEAQVTRGAALTVDLKPSP